MKVYIKNTKFDKLRVRLVESVKKHFRNETDEEKKYAVSFLECVGSDESYRYMFLRAIQATNDITRLQRFKKSDFGHFAGKCVLVLILKTICSTRRTRRSLWIFSPTRS